LKNFIKFILQRVLGYRKYLLLFAQYKIRTLKHDVKEKDFFFFLGLLQPNERLVLDVGANIGIMTAHLGKALPNTPILAIEPMPDNLYVLNHVVTKNGLSMVDIKPVAVGEHSGEIEMILPIEQGAKQQGLSHVVHESITTFNSGETIKVPLMTLDELVADRPVQGIKIDVENYEYYALLGAKKMLNAFHPPIYMELWENENREHCFKFLSELGYFAYVVVENTLVEYDPSHHKQQNFIFKVQ